MKLINKPKINYKQTPTKSSQPKHILNTNQLTTTKHHPLKLSNELSNKLISNLINHKNELIPKTHPPQKKQTSNNSRDDKINN